MSFRPRVALTGATGFIGSRVADGLLEHGADVTALTRNAERPFPRGITPVAADLESGEGLLEALAGREILLHVASYVGSDERMQHHVNVRGTERLLAAARGAGVSRIVYLSTAGVYGGALGAGGDEAQLRPSPRSALSRSRREAEIRVEAAGGTVVRPNMVVGAGDTWFLLPLLKLLLALGAWIEDGAARVSTINVASLGRVLARLALTPHEGGVFHAASPEPLAIRDLVTPVLVAAGREVPARSLSLDEARRLLVQRGVSEKQLDIVARDNILDARRLSGLVPKERQLPGLLPYDVAWYTERL